MFGGTEGYAGGSSGGCYEVLFIGYTGCYTLTLDITYITDRKNVKRVQNSKKCLKPEN